MYRTAPPRATLSHGARSNHLRTVVPRMRRRGIRSPSTLSRFSHCAALLLVAALGCRRDAGTGANDRPQAAVPSPTPDPLLEGKAWEVVSVQTTSAGTSKRTVYGARRHLLAFSRGNIVVLQCPDGMSAADPLLFHPGRDCPTSGLQCLEAIPYSRRESSQLRYRATIASVICLPSHGSNDEPKSSGCPGPSPMPRVWPFLGLTKSDYKTDGSQLQLRHSIGSYAVVVDAHALPHLQLPRPEYCGQAINY